MALLEGVDNLTPLRKAQPGVGGMGGVMGY